MTALAADLTVPLTTPLPEVDAVVMTLPPGPDVSSYRTALAHLAAALPARPTRTVFVSSTGVFDGAGSSEPVTERVEPAPTTNRGRGLRDGEKLHERLFGGAPSWIPGAERTADLYLLMETDGAAAGSGFSDDRERLQGRLAEELTGRQLPHRRLSGSWKEREAAAVQAVDALLKSKSPAGGT